MYIHMPMIISLCMLMAGYMFVFVVHSSVYVRAYAHVYYMCMFIPMCMFLPMFMFLFWCMPLFTFMFILMSSSSVLCSSVNICVCL